jgi:hypothetical protein
MQVNLSAQPAVQQRAYCIHAVGDDASPVAYSLLPLPHAAECMDMVTHGQNLLSFPSPAVQHSAYMQSGQSGASKHTRAPQQPLLPLFLAAVNCWLHPPVTYCLLPLPHAAEG